MRSVWSSCIICPWGPFLESVQLANLSLGAKVRFCPRNLVRLSCFYLVRKSCFSKFKIKDDEKILWWRVSRELVTEQLLVRLKFIQSLWNFAYIFLLSKKDYVQSLTSNASVSIEIEGYVKSYGFRGDFAHFSPGPIFSLSKKTQKKMPP